MKTTLAYTKTILLNFILIIETANT